MRRYLSAFLFIIFFAFSSYGAEMGLKLGYSSLSYSSVATGESKDINFTLTGSVYIDYDIPLSENSAFSPSFQIDYAYKTTGYVYLYGYGYAEEKFTYTGFEINGKGKIFLSRTFMIYGGGGVSMNRFAIDYTLKSGDSLTSDEETYLGLQAFGGFQFLITKILGLGAEYKYKVYNDDSTDYTFDNQSFITAHIFIRFK